MHAVHDTIWQTIDQTLLGLAARAGDLDAEIGRWLVAASREGVHRHFGFASFAEYVERRLGFDARTTRERLRVARAIEELPEVRRLLASGERSWSAVREITRVATPENESTWVARTERMTVRQIERLVAGRKPGDDPTDAKDPLLTTRRVVFELEAEAYAGWREASEAVRRVIGPGASDKEVFRAMCEIALGRRDEAKPGYQVSLTVCTRCDRSWRQSGPDAIRGSVLGRRARGLRRGGGRVHVCGRRHCRTHRRTHGADPRGSDPRSHRRAPPDAGRPWPGAGRLRVLRPRAARADDGDPAARRAAR